MHRHGPHNLLVPWYLMASYAYYVEDDPILSDGLYDHICQELAEAIDRMDVDHDHLHLVDIGALAAGSAYNLKAEDYPQRTIASMQIARSSQKPKGAVR